MTGLWSQSANSMDGQFTLNPPLSPVLYFPYPHLRMWGGNFRPGELQEVQLGLRPSQNSAMLCEPLPPCPCPTTPGRSLKKRHGGQWWAGLGSGSPPSTPEPGGETTRATHVRAFSHNNPSLMPAGCTAEYTCAHKNMGFLRPTPSPFLPLRSLCLTQTPTHSHNSLINLSLTITYKTPIAHMHLATHSKSSLMLAGDLMGFSQG